jgi:hypothetical protein
MELNASFLPSLIGPPTGANGCRRSASRGRTPILRWAAAAGSEEVSFSRPGQQLLNWSAAGPVDSLGGSSGAESQR